MTTTIGVKLVRSPQHVHQCHGRLDDQCERTMRGPHLRLFGRDGGKVRTLRLCLGCARRSDDPRVREAADA